MSNSVQVRIKSDTGDLVALIDPATEVGKNLRVELLQNKIGGLRSFTFYLDRKTEVPLYSEMQIEVYFNGALWFTGYTGTVPIPETNDVELVIDGFGYFKKLELKVLNQTYTNTTIGAIIAGLDLTGLGINYNVTKINAPGLTISSIEFKDKDYNTVLNSLLKIANYQYDTTQYVYGVDEDKDIYFKPLDTGVVQNFYEGYDFQNPEVDRKVKVVNEVLSYRTTLADSKITEYVNTYQDLNSQARNGLHSKKLIFPDYADNTTIANIADAILKEYKDPKVRASFENFILQEQLSDGFYGVAVKPEEYWLVVNECDSLEGWDLSNAVNTTVSVSSERVLTGRSAFKIVTSNNSAGDFIEYTLEGKITNPLELRLFVYFLNDVTDITVEYIDSLGSSVPVTVSTIATNAVDQWLKYTQFIGSEITDGVYDIDIGAGPDIYTIDIGAGIEDYEVRTGKDNLLIDIVKVKITFNSNNVRTLYLDRLGTNAATWAYNKLTLEEVKYELTRDYVVSSPQFGEAKETLLSNIDKEVQDGQISFDIYSKQ